MCIPGRFRRLTTFSHIDQLGSIRMFLPSSWIKNEACPIQVMQISPGPTFGKRVRVRSPERLVKSEGIRTSVMKLRLCQSTPGFRPTRVADGFFVPLAAPVRTTLVRFFREKGVGTVGQRYKLTRVKQSVWRPRRMTRPNDTREAGE